MARVVFTQNIQRHVTCPPAEVAGNTVCEVLETVFAKNDRARGYVLDDQGSLRKHMIVQCIGEHLPPIYCVRFVK